MRAARVEPGRHLVLAAAPDDRVTDTWGFYLREVTPNRTRLIARVRNEARTCFADRVAQYGFWEPAHFVMERKMLLTIKRLAEEAPAKRAAALPGLRTGGAGVA
jgi:hypothetical protein